MPSDLMRQFELISHDPNGVRVSDRRYQSVSGTLEHAILKLSETAAELSNAAGTQRAGTFGVGLYLSGSLELAS